MKTPTFLLVLPQWSLQFLLFLSGGRTVFVVVIRYIPPVHLSLFLFPSMESMELFNQEIIWNKKTEILKYGNNGVILPSVNVGEN